MFTGYYQGLPGASDFHPNPPLGPQLNVPQWTTGISIKIKRRISNIDMGTPRVQEVTKRVFLIPKLVLLNVSVHL